MIDLGKNFFDRHQRELVAFANTRVGRWFFQLKKGLGVGPDFRVMELHPHAVSGNWKVVKGRLVKTTVFSVDNHFQKRLEYVVGRAAQVIGPALAWKLAQPSAAFGLLPLMVMGTVTDFVPVAGANSPCDGMVRRYSGTGGETFSDIRAGAGTDAYVTDNAIEIILNSTAFSDKYNLLYRGILNFDTSDIGIDLISAASLKLYATSKAVDLGDTSIDATAVTPDSTDTVITSDYADFGTTSFGSIASISSATLSAYNEIALDADGRAYIDASGVTSFGIKLGWDVSGASSPTWASSVNTKFYFASADSGSNKPTLTVTHAHPTADDARDAELTGEAGASASRSAELTGTADAASSRAAEVTGEDGADASRSAELTGEAGASASRSAELTGTADAASSRAAEVTGEDGADASRSAELTGEAGASAARNAELTGEASSSASRASELHGEDGADASRSAEITGELSADASRSAELTGEMNHPRTSFANGGGGSWDTVVAVAIDHAKVPSDLTDFQLYVRLSDLGDAFWDAVQDGGADIRVTDIGGVELAREVVSCATATKTGELWVKVPSVSSSADTVINIYVGDGSAYDYAPTDTYGAQAVWGASAKYVGHFEGDADDSSASGWNGTVDGATQVSGKCGLAYIFDRTNDYISFPSWAVTPSSITVSGWFSNTFFAINQYCFDNQTSDDLYLYFCLSSSNDIRFAWRNTDSTSSSVSTGNIESIFADGLLHKIDGILDLGAMKQRIYVDGELKGEVDYVGTPKSFTETFVLGCRGGLSSWFGGSIDEFRIWLSPNSTALIAAEYANQSDPGTFYAVVRDDSNRSAELHGEADASAFRSAQVTGELSAGASRAAELHGEDTDSASRVAELTGEDFADASRSAELTGEDAADASRSAELHGEDWADASCFAELHGEDGADASMVAELHGEAVSSDNMAVELTGEAAASGSRAAELHGTDDADAIRSAELTGELYSDSSRAAELHGEDSADAGRLAELTGEATLDAFLSAELHGEAEATGSRGAEIMGATTPYPYVRRASPYVRYAGH